MTGYHKKLFLRNLNSKHAGTHNIEEKIKLSIENYYSNFQETVDMFLCNEEKASCKSLFFKNQLAY